MSPRQHILLHMVRTRGKQSMEFQCHLVLHAFSRYYSLWGDWCQNGSIWERNLTVWLEQQQSAETEQKHLPWWLSLIWQNINLDHLPKNAPVTKVTSFLLPGPMPSTGDAGGCPFLTLPNQPLSRCCMVQYPFPDALPSPVLELFWDKAGESISFQNTSQPCQWFLFREHNDND